MNSRNKINLVDVTEAKSVTIDKKCAKCAKSICCSSINQKVPTPRTIYDFDHLLWQVSHENIAIFKDSDGWFLHVHSACEHLGERGVCQIYAQRPMVCREYDNDYCEFDEPIPEAAEHFFETYKQFEKYCRKRFKKWDKRFKKAGYA
jgi:Fe-S-cluster containining protein